MSTPHRLYRYGAGKISSLTGYSAAGFNATAGTANLVTPQPGEMGQIDSGFVVHGGGSPVQNDRVQITHNATSTTFWVILHHSNDPAGQGWPSCYSGANMALEFQTQAIAAALAAGVPQAAPTCTWSDTTKKFTIGFAQSCNVLFGTAGIVAQRLAATMGFDPADTGLITSQASDSAVFCEDRQWMTFKVPAGDLPMVIKAVMVYGTNLDSGDTIQLYGSSKFLGPDWVTLASQAEYQGTEFTSFASGINEMYVWKPEESHQYWHFSINRKSAATASSNTKIGVVQLWDSAIYAGRRNFRTPWVMNPLSPDVLNEPELGGASYRLEKRARYQGSLVFRGWGRTQYQEYEQLWTKFGRDLYLWDLDPDNTDNDTRENTLIFGRMAELRHVGTQGPFHNQTDFDVDVAQVPMHPRGT